MSKDRYAELDGGRGRLRYRTVGDGPELVVLHTFRGQLEYSDLIVPALGSAHRVHQVDLPGHGLSTHDPDLTYTAQEFVEQVESFVDAVGLESFTLLGESIGATISLALASRMPDRVEGVFAFNPHDGGSLIGGALGAVVSWTGKFTTLIPRMESPLLGLLLRRGYATPNNLDADYLGLLKTTAATQPAHAKVMTSTLAHAGTWAELRATYPAIPVQLPVRLVYGDHNWGPPHLISENTAALAAVDEAVILPDTGHFSFRDNPSAATEIVLGRTKT